MPHYKIINCLLIVTIVILIIVSTPSRVDAQSAPFNAYDLIGAVNALRADHGLPNFNINGSLMASAQAHSEYQASIDTMTHNGPGGITANERALAAGYGGRVSENIAVFTLDFENVMTWLIYDAWADDLHMNTMINPQYQDAGAGVAIGNGRVYITLDAGWPEGAYPLPTRQTWTPVGETTPGILTTITFAPIVVSTPLVDGSIYHVVGFGQSLIGIAGAYGVSVTDLAAINNINPDQIYVGQKLIIHKMVTPTTTAEPSETPITITPAFTPTSPAIQTPPATASPMRNIGMVIIIVCVFIAGLLLFLNRR